MRHVRPLGVAALAVMLLLVVGLAGWLLSRSHNVQLFGEIVARVETDQPMVALTFDDGPSPYTQEVIDILAAADVRATFFLIGKDIEARPEAARALVEAGHEIGNHSYS
ncbi:MAG: polysaccharide deacetylase family protein, partial [Maritimibacter sp.]